MAVLYFAGAETGDLSELEGPAFAAIESSIFKTGAYSYRVAPSTLGGPVFTNGLVDTTLYFRAHSYIEVTVNPSVQTDYILYYVNGYLQINLRVTDAGDCSVILHNFVTTTDIGSPFSISKNIWYTVEFKLIVSPTNGIMELKINQSIVASDYGSNTGSSAPSQIGAAFYAANTQSINANHYVDDVVVSNTAYLGDGGCIARQGKAGSTTYDTFTKVGGATIEAVWSDTPPNTGTNATSIVNGGAQTMLVSSFSEQQSGHGVEYVRSSSTINACKTAMIAKVATGSNHSMRRRLNSSDTDTVKTITTSDVYYQDSIWTDTVANLNSAEIGVLHGADVNLLTIEDMWLIVDYRNSWFLGP